MSFTPFQPSDPFSREAFNTILQSLFDTTDDLVAGKISLQTGSYAGSGAKTRTLSFEFPPKLLIIMPNDRNTLRYCRGFYLRGMDCISGSTANIPDNTATVSGNDLTLSINGDAVYIHNASGTTYYYIAIG